MLRTATTMFVCTMMFAADQALADAGKAEAFMNEVLARYREVQSYSHETVNTFKIEFNSEIDAMMKAPPETRTSFYYQRPGRFALRGGRMLDVYSDGSKLTAYAKDVNKYAHMEAGPDTSLGDLPGMFGMFMPQEFPIASFILDGPETFAQSGFHVQTWGELTESELDGRVGHLVSCSVEGGMPGMPATDATIWVDAKTGLIGRIEFDLLEQMKTMMPGGMGGPPPTVAKRIIAYNNVKLNEPIAEEDLAFTPGDGDEMVETLPTIQEIMAAAYGMDVEGGGVEADAGPELGAAAPGFTATTLDGKTISLADLEGKVVLLDFWATWCTPCVQAMPTIQSLHEKYADKGLVVIGISLDDSGAAERLGEFVKEKGVTFAQIHDTEGTIARSFGVSPIPHSVLIGKDGTVQANHIGFVPGMEKMFSEEIEKLLEGKPLTDG